jgi:hypothetical protein
MLKISVENLWANLLSLFSAIFAYFRQTVGVFLANQFYGPIFAERSKNKKRQKLFRLIFGKNI